MESGQDNEEGPPAKEEAVMKKIGEYTTRGNVGDGAFDRITLFDGRFDTAYKVVEFTIFPTSPFDTNGDVYATLLTQEDAAGATTWRADDNTQLAWSSWSVFGTDSITSDFNLIDPDNLIVEDLFIYCNSNGNDNCNYFIRLEKYDITDWQGALSMVRNKSQA